jgi:hypothetical protein
LDHRSASPTAYGCSDDQEHNLIVQALNEAFIEQGRDHPVEYHHLYKRPDGAPWIARTR